MKKKYLFYKADSKWDQISFSVMFLNLKFDSYDLNKNDVIRYPM